MAELVPVEQCDREAAAELESEFGENLYQMIVEGCIDGTDSVQAFARHRLSERAEIVAWLRSRDPWDISVSNALNFYCDAIERGEHRKDG